MGKENHRKKDRYKLWRGKKKKGWPEQDENIVK